VGGRGHRGQSRRIGQDRRQHLLEPICCYVRIRDHDRSTDVDKRLGIEALVVVRRRRIGH